MNQGHMKVAARIAREGLAIQPGNFEGQALLCQVEAAQRDLEAARRVRTQLSLSSNPDAALPALACGYHIAIAERDRKIVLAITEGAAKGFPDNGVAANDVGIGYARAGDYDKAIGWFETAYRLREPQLCAVEYSNPEIKSFYADWRWTAFRDKPGFRDWEAARAEIAKRFQLGE
jgi:tetratricopeptide (TPR) repeat protein